MSNIQPLHRIKAESETDPFLHESEVRSYCRSFDATFSTAKGSRLTCANGRSYIDFLAGCSALNYGHNDPDMVAALLEYLETGGVAMGLDLHTQAKAQFIDTFVRLILERRSLAYRLQFPGPTGTNAVEAAMKLARKVTGRSQILAFTNGFHGCSTGALAATANRHHRMGAAVQLHGVTRTYFDGYLGPDVDTAGLLDKALSDPSSGFDLPAAILVETVQGEGGLNVASGGWMKKIARIARKHGALLIVDDIQAGCGRTGSFFSFEPHEIEPDIVVLSKSLSGFGLPMSLVLIRPDIDQWAPGEHNGTFRGDSLAFITAAIALRKFWSDDDLMRDVRRRGKMIRAALEDMTKLIPAARVKGRGMMLGLDVGNGRLAGAISQRCFANGLIIETSGARGEVVKVLAPLTTPDELLCEGLGILRAAVEQEAARTQRAS